MRKLTIYTYLDEDNVPYVECYVNHSLTDVIEAGSGWTTFNSEQLTDDVTVVHVDWNEVKNWDAGAIEDVEALIGALRHLPNKRQASELARVDEWLEVNEPEDYDGNEQLWMDCKARVADALVMLQ